MLRPAVIQLRSPGRIGWSEPRLSRWTISPSNRYVTVARPMCGCGGTSIEPSTRREGAVHLVEEGEGADHPARCGRKNAPDRDAAEVAGAAVDHVRDHGQRAARTERFGRRLDAHRGIPAAILWGGRPVVDLSPSHST